MKDEIGLRRQKQMTIRSFSEMLDEQTVDRYRQNYGLGNDIGLEHVKNHWELETALTERLRRSSKMDRWKVFDECYTELYAKLPWLNKTEEQGHDYSPWSVLIGDESKIFEVGSGKAQLMKYLASLGHKCVATEITHERGAKHAADNSGLTWHRTDGINLALFEEDSSYDVVISTQVVEHLHPDDILDHFNNAAKILKVGGRYIFDTPHRGAGPHDLSRVFDLDLSICMHLKEYSFMEMSSLLKRAGFSAVAAVLYRGPEQQLPIGPYSSRWFFRYCLSWDWLIERIHVSRKLERKLRNGPLPRLLLPTNIWICATK